MSFAHLNLDPRISKAIDLCGYETPTPIQSQCIPEILNGNDLVASAQTGTGKTAAFVWPSLQHLINRKPTPKPKILVLTPTRELANQIGKAYATYGKLLKLSIVNLLGGMGYRDQIRALSKPVDVIVATPGRLLDHLENRRVDLSNVELFILDEADRMLDMGFIDDVEAIAKKTSQQRQTLLFSATMDDKLSRIVKHLLKNPIRIDIASEKSLPSQIEQKLYLVDNLQHKMQLLQHFLKNEQIFKAIIFSATKIHADQLAGELRATGLKADALHGDLNQSKRNRIIQDLRNSRIQFLVATDVAARGIDISDITHVINFDLPRFCEDYVHRIGRTGRAGKSGIAISFAQSSSSDMRHLQRIERFTSQTLKRDIVVGLEPSARSKSNTSFKKKKNSSSTSNFRSERSERSERRSDRPSYSKKKPSNANKFEKRDGISTSHRNEREPRKDGDNRSKSFAGRGEKKVFSDRDKPFVRKSYADDDRKPTVRSKRSFADKPFAKKSYADDDKKPTVRSKRSFADKPFAKKSYADDDKKPAVRSKRSFADKPFAKKSYADDDKKPAVRSKRSFADKPFAKKSYADDDKKPAVRSKRSFSDKKPFAKKSYAEGDKKPAARSKRSFSDKKPFDDKPRKQSHASAK